MTARRCFAPRTGRRRWAAPSTLKPDFCAPGRALAPRASATARPRAPRMPRPSTSQEARSRRISPITRTSGALTATMMSLPRRLKAPPPRQWCCSFMTAPRPTASRAWPTILGEGAAARFPSSSGSAQAGCAPTPRSSSSPAGPRSSSSKAPPRPMSRRCSPASARASIRCRRRALRPSAAATTRPTPWPRASSSRRTS